MGSVLFFLFNKEIGNEWIIGLKGNYPLPNWQKGVAAFYFLFLFFSFLARRGFISNKNPGARSHRVRIFFFSFFSFFFFFYL